MLSPRRGLFVSEPPGELFEIPRESFYEITLICAGGDLRHPGSSKPLIGFVFGEKGLIADLSFEGSKINKLDK